MKTNDKYGDSISISFIVTLEDILKNSGADYELIYLPDSKTYVLKLNDEIAHLI
jgi:hypothetical protein